MEKLKDIHKNVNFEENNIFIAYERFWMLMNVFERLWTRDVNRYVFSDWYIE